MNIFCHPSAVTMRQDVTVLCRDQFAQFVI